MILIVGATGQLGGLVARQLLERGRRVRILVRDGSDFSSLEAAGAEPVFGDLKEPETLRRACEDVTTVITTANSAGRAGPDDVQTVDRQGNRSLIDAAAQAGVEHFIFVSALGASEDSPSDFLRAKAETEKHLRDSGMAWTIIKPNLFMEVWVEMIAVGPLRAGRPVTLVGEGRRRHSFVSRSDVAAFTVAAVDHPDARGAEIVVGGPEAVSWRDVIEACERIRGEPAEVRTISPGEPLPGLPPVVSGLAASFDSYDSPVDMTMTAQRYGVRPTPLDSYLRRSLGS